MNALREKQTDGINAQRAILAVLRKGGLMSAYGLANMGMGSPASVRVHLSVLVNHRFVEKVGYLYSACEQLPVSAKR